MQTPLTAWLEEVETTSSMDCRPFVLTFVTRIRMTWVAWNTKSLLSRTSSRELSVNQDLISWSASRTSSTRSVGIEGLFLTLRISRRRLQLGKHGNKGGSQRCWDSWKDGGDSGQSWTSWDGGGDAWQRSRWHSWTPHGQDSSRWARTSRKKPKEANNEKSDSWDAVAWRPRLSDWGPIKRLRSISFMVRSPLPRRWM